MHILADNRTMNLFRDIASTKNNRSIIISLRLTRKQYYSRLSDLIKSGLIYRRKGKYYLTTFGKIVYDVLTNAQRKIDYAINNIWKLKAIDSLEAYEEPSKEELKKIVDSFIDNTEIKEVITKEQYSMSCNSLVTEEVHRVKYDITGDKIYDYKTEF